MYSSHKSNWTNCCTGTCNVSGGLKRFFENYVQTRDCRLSWEVLGHWGKVEEVCRLGKSVDILAVLLLGKVEIFVQSVFRKL